MKSIASLIVCLLAVACTALPTPEKADISTLADPLMLEDMDGALSGHVGGFWFRRNPDLDSREYVVVRRANAKIISSRESDAGRLRYDIDDSELWVELALDADRTGCHPKRVHLGVVDREDATTDGINLPKSMVYGGFFDSIHASIAVEAGVLGASDEVCEPLYVTFDLSALHDLLEAELLAAHCRGEEVFPEYAAEYQLMLASYVEGAPVNVALDIRDGVRTVPDDHIYANRLDVKDMEKSPLNTLTDPCTSLPITGVPRLHVWSFRDFDD